MIVRVRSLVLVLLLSQTLGCQRPAPAAGGPTPAPSGGQGSLGRAALRFPPDCGQRCQVCVGTVDADATRATGITGAQAAAGVRCLLIDLENDGDPDLLLPTDDGECTIKKPKPLRVFLMDGDRIVKELAVEDLACVRPLGVQPSMTVAFPAPRAGFRGVRSEGEERLYFFDDEKIVSGVVPFDGNQ